MADFRQKLALNTDFLFLFFFYNRKWELDLLSSFVEKDTERNV
ncbi:hypothetical protein A0O32_1680 [Anoxybacillus flavithermus]|nr:hypothetical protein A0O32_1680 [Anoxybacillus flavithermus]